MGVNNASNTRYPVPIALLGRRVAIYAAGNVGKTYYDQLKFDRKHSVVLWVDRNWEELSRLGIPVKGMDNLKTTEYDTLLIAIESDKIALEIKKELMAFGVSEEKIVY